MSYNFSINNLAEFISQNKNINKTNNTIIFPKEIGDFSIKETLINKDIFLFHTNMNLKQNINLESKGLVEGLYINILLEGSFNYKNTNNDFQYNMIKNKTSLSFINETAGYTEIKSNTKYQSVGILVRGDFLEKNLLNHISNIDELKQKSISLLKNSPTNYNTSICVNQLFNSPKSKNLDHLYKESKVLEILFYEFQDILNNTRTNNQKVKFDEYDFDALDLAKEILIQNIKNPPSIKELSKKVKLNEFKLKIGFKQRFHTTPYNMLIKYRMEKSKELLENTDMNILEISQKIGYKYQANFSEVFLKYYGIRPKEILKTRKYYF